MGEYQFYVWGVIGIDRMYERYRLHETGQWHLYQQRGVMDC